MPCPAGPLYRPVGVSSGAVGFSGILSGGISATDCGAEIAMTISETDFAYRLDRWDTYGGNIIHHIAIIDDLELAMAAYEAACKHGRARPSHCGKAHASLRPPPFNGRTLDGPLGVDAK